MTETLKNAPLLEVIFEMKWANPAPYSKTDPNYPMLMSRVYDRFTKAYPFYSTLPTSQLPDEMAQSIPQHQFRVGDAKWPLVQVGPGILTVNDTQKYDWDDFKERCINAVGMFFEAHPKPTDIRINNLLLRYLDGVKFSNEKSSILDFLKNNLKLQISLQNDNIKKCKIKENPLTFTGRFEYPLEEPKGIIGLGFQKGRIKEEDALVWETIVLSRDKEIPKMPEDFESWLEPAHQFCHDWFFGSLSKEFKKKFE